MLIELDIANLYDVTKSNINEITNQLTEKLIVGRDEFMPSKKVKIKPFDLIWFTAESIKLLNKRNRK